jgi:DNA-directed RNA polymerase III subunit RPC3
MDPTTQLNVGLASTPLTNGVNGHAPPHINSVKSRPNKKSAVDPASDGNDSDAPTNPLKRKHTEIHNTKSSVQAIISHLELLAAGPRKFVIQTHYGWSVPFKTLTRTLIHHEILNTITARFGPLSSRIIRILHTNYSCDEKTLAQAAILKAKEVRATTTTLLAAGLLATQEVPRDSNRTTNRLLWLYSYSPVAARKALLTDSYRAMLRLMRRLEAEKARWRPLLEKSERLDVIGHEDKYLTAGERRELQQMAEREVEILAAVARIDDLVACLRDFAPLQDPFIGNRRRPEQEGGENSE